jgi:uncharacterized protein YdaU (DUF1376 family)
MKFYPHHISDYSSSTAHLSFEEDCCYRRLLDRYYDTESPIENDPAMLARKIRVGSEVVAGVLSEFFFLVDGLWHNRRADQEIARWYDKSNKARQSAEVRWTKQKDNADAVRSNSGRNANAMRTHSEGNATQDPIPNTQESTTKTRASRFDAAASLSALGVDDQVAMDWIQHRKAKRAAVTQTVIDGIANEAAKARITLSAALALSCQRGWTGFKADWVAEQPSRATLTNDRASKRESFLAELTGRARTPAKDVFQGNTIEGELA